MANKNDFQAFLERNRDTLELDEDTYIGRLRSAGVFKTFEAEVLERVQFRHLRKLMEGGAFDKRSPRARAPRKPSPRSLIEQAERAGKTVSSIERDGVKLGFGEAAADTNQQSDEVETWIKKHAH